jgi:hypothetical protein
MKNKLVGVALVAVLFAAPGCAEREHNVDVESEKGETEQSTGTDQGDQVQDEDEQGGGAEDSGSPTTQGQ